MGETGDRSGHFRRRLEAAAGAVAGYLDEYEDEIETRDAIILEAIDAGEAQRDVARWAGLSQSRINQVVVRRAAEAQHATAPR